MDPLEGGIQISWTAVPGVEYWLYYKAGTHICKNCTGSSDSWTSGGAAIGLRNSPISSPYYLPNLTNGTSYAFMMDARINGGAAGEATPSSTTASRLAGSSWTAASNLGSSNVKSVVFNGSTYLGLGTLGAKYQSTDGRTWTAITSTDATNYRSATYAFSKFVGVGAGGAVVYTSDLQTWTPTVSHVSSNLNAVYGNGALLVAVGDQGAITTSSDGATWAAATTVPTSAPLYGVNYSTGLGLWVAVGEKGLILTSTDGLVWTTARAGSNTDPDLQAVASLTNTSPSTTHALVAVAQNGTFLQSSSGSTWTSAAPITSGTTTSLNAIVASTGQSPSNQFLVVGDGGKAFTSPDGLSWMAYTTSTNQSLIGVVRGLYNGVYNQYLAWAANGTTSYSK